MLKKSGTPLTEGHMRTSLKGPIKLFTLSIIPLLTEPSDVTIRTLFLFFKHLSNEDK
jgi:hypothetical protein